MYTFIGAGKHFLRGVSARALMSGLNPGLAVAALGAPLAIMALAPSAARADTFLDLGNSLSGWTTKGTTVVQNTTATSNYGGTPFTLTPAVGEQMVKITADGSSVTVGAVDALLGLSNGTAAAAISSGSTNFGLITKSYTLQAGTYTFGWAYAAGDYLPYSDGVFFSVGGQGVSQFNILARNGAASIVPGTAGYPVGALILQSYGNTPWITASFDVTTAGSYQLGFGGFNALDNGLSPVLFVSAVIGTFTGTPVGSSGGTPLPPPPPPPPVSTDIDTAASGGYDASQLGSSLNAVFTGGTLYFTTGGQTFAQDFVLGNSATNTIDLSGLSTTFSGDFTDQSSNGSLIFTNTGTGGVIILSGANTYTGATTIGSGAQISLTGAIANTSNVLIQNGGYLVIANGGALTAGGVTNAAGGTLIISQGATLTDDMDNAGEVGNAGTSNAIVATNTGTIANTGVWNGAVNSNAGTLSNAGVWNGNVATSGTFASTGTLNGSLNNTGSAQVSGAINGAVTNSGTFALSGDLTGNGSGFSNTGALAVGNHGFGGAGAVSNSAAGTISVGSSVGAGWLNAASLSNAGAVHMANGRTGDAVNVTGVYTGAAGSVLSFDVNLLTGAADRLTVGTLSGASTVRINNVAGAKTYLAAPVVLVSAAAGDGTLTADTDAGTTSALATQSLIQYSLRNIAGTKDWGIVSTLNTPALTSLTTSLTSYVTAQNLNLAELPDEVFVRDGEYGVNQLLGNSWARAYSGDLSLEQGFTISDAYSDGTTTKALSSQDGVQFGFDAGVYNIHGTGLSLRAGLMAGSTTARVNDETLAGANIRIDAPNYGYYAALTHDGLRLSVQNRSEVMKTEVTNPVLGLASSRLKARSETFSVTLSKRFDVRSLFVEPSLGVMTTRVDANTLHLPNDMGGVKIALLKSRLIHAGARVGTTLTTRSAVWTPYGELNAWQEGAAKTQTAYLPEAAGPVWLTGSRAGTFGQALVGMTAQSRENENLSGYVTADVRRGDTLDGWTVRAGVKYRMK